GLKRGSVIGNSIKRGDSFRRLSAIGQESCLAQARQHRIRSVSILAKLAQLSQRFVTLAFRCKLKCVRERVARLIGTAGRPVLVSDKCSGGENDQRGRTNHQGPEAVPERFELFLAKFLIDLANETVVGHQTSHSWAGR